MILMLASLISAPRGQNVFTTCWFLRVWTLLYSFWTGGNIHPHYWHNFSSSNLRSNRNLPIVEDSYYLRRNQSFYIHVLNDGADQKEVKSLFLSNFYSKVLNAVAITRSKSKDSFLVWTKSPCDSVPPKLANIWTKSSGFRQGYNIPNITNSQIMWHLNFTFSKDTIFESGILRNLYCRVIKGATQHWPPFTYITKNQGMKFTLNRESLKGSSQVVWNQVRKLCLVYLLQAGNCNVPPHILATWEEPYRGSLYFQTHLN